MRIELVNTGDELLLGDTINTNAAWLGQQIAALGLMVSRHLVVSDGAVIKDAMAEAASRSDVVKPMMETLVEPRLRTLLPDGASRSIRYFKVTGLGESDIVERVEKKLEAIPDLILGYCIRQGDVDVRLSGQPGPVALGEAIVREHLGDHIVSTDRRLIEEVIVQALAERGQWLATAESCTGGFLSNRITDVSGASRVFGHGFITYANEAKQKHLGVPADMLDQHGAVSEPVARAMAEGALATSGADHALALTGIAGPTGGSEEKPVGTVFVGLASKGGETLVKKFFYPGTRDRFKLLASQAAFDMLRRRLLGLKLD